jgi:hypothetical protein
VSSSLRELLDAGVITRDAAGEGPSYALTEAGRELAATVRELGTWGQRWLPRALSRDELGARALLWDVRQRVRLAELPDAPIVVRIELTDTRARATWFLLLRRAEVSLCAENPGFPEELRVRTPLRALTAWWRGDVSLTEARAAGMVIDGRREWVRAFPRWFERYVFAGVEPQEAGGADSVPHGADRGV